MKTPGIQQQQEHEPNWCHIRETVLLLNLTVARLEHAMKEGDQSILTLTSSFTEIVHAAKRITEATTTFPDSADKILISDSSDSITQCMQTSIVAFQFYDKLSQRITHVSKSLSSLTEVMNDPSKAGDQKEWQILQNNIRSKYMLDSDQKMFDDILSGMSIEEALKNVQAPHEENEIDFF